MFLNTNWRSADWIVNINVLAAGRLIAKLHCVDNNLHPRFHRHQFISSQSVFCFFFFFISLTIVVIILLIYIYPSFTLLYYSSRSMNTLKINKMLTFGDERRKVQVNNYSPIIKWDHPGSTIVVWPIPLRNFMFQSWVWDWFPGIFSNFNCTLHTRNTEFVINKRSIYHDRDIIGSRYNVCNDHAKIKPDCHRFKC